MRKLNPLPGKDLERGKQEPVGKNLQGITNLPKTSCERYGPIPIGTQIHISRHSFLREQHLHRLVEDGELGQSRTAPALYMAYIAGNLEVQHNRLR